MRAHVPSYEVETPSGLADALTRLSEHGAALRPLAGGTDLMVLLEAGHLPPGRFLNIWGLRELRGVTVSDDAVTLGALTTYADVLAHPVLAAELPMLGLAARETGAAAIQNRGTVGGNIVNASPAADTPPALLAYGAEVELASVRGTRRVPYAAFHRGYKQMDRAPDELLTAVHLPRHAAPGWVHCYRKVGTRKAQSISKVCFAGAARLQGDLIAEVRIGLGSVAPVPLRCPATEAVLTGRRLSDATLAHAARAAILTEATPIDDIRSTREYRAEVTGNLLEQFLRVLAGGA